ncbi:MAG TPA: hypothetical protein VMH02_09255 [Verrucomicrobiae bacterium]|nr:hypothetical protein [Verrucomicrobiae bacterium]
MGLESPEASNGNGLKTALDTVVAPKDAFESLRSAPTWGWALIVAAVLLVAGNAMQRPAQLHAAIGTLQHMMATNSLFSSMSDAQKQEALEKAQHPSALQTALSYVGVVVSLFIAALVNSVVLLLASLAGRGTADFKRLWAGSMNIAIPTFGLNYVVLGAICLVLGPEHFQTSADIMRSAPGLATIVPDAHGFLGGALLGLNVFTVWGCGLNVTMMRVTSGVRGAAAWIGPVVVLLGGALISGASANFTGI